MFEPVKVSVELFEVPLYPEATELEEAVYVSEGLVESIARRLRELHLTPADVIVRLYKEEVTEAELQEMLEEEIAMPEWLFRELLGLTGLQLAAIPSNRRYQDLDAHGGHWYYGERCVYCHSNMYDVGLYGPEKCEESPVAEKSEAS